MLFVVSKIAVEIFIDDNNSAKLFTTNDVPFFVVPTNATIFLSLDIKLLLLFGFDAVCISLWKSSSRSSSSSSSNNSISSSGLSSSLLSSSITLAVFYSCVFNHAKKNTSNF